MYDKNGRLLGHLRPQDSFDEATLKEVASETGGRYFRATSKEKLGEIYKEIDKMEKEKIDVNVTKRENEKFYPFAILAAILLMLEVLIGNTILRTLT
jgi:Ca-activated chloride channel family protein